ncbi:PulJ/GspJ family protein [Paenibacillus lemnae]|uniref:Prepilin-type N-terminal cleavage/methylation domain-containing protein n=1 Tax=Paenibacillus lemnae TaxID=1330551 RepID=A0A848M8S1_PAELE|nr:prepilin-type N-terminal cleavage/methylation domain-containing protein [Paenibacillus lemnae]NMO96659.1 prepilin-type N-terminal cleavage/methylation domain-containing protein [Paenibacillus lemnae]
MKKFVNRIQLHRQDGFTLIELIAALAVFSLIAGLISAVTIFGFRQYNRITLENSLREEGDIAMSSVMTELYTFAPDYIMNVEGSSGIILQKGEGDTAEKRRIEIVNGTLVMGQASLEAADLETGSPYEIDADLTGSLIQAQTADGRACRSSAPCASGLIDIRLKLTRTAQQENHGMELESKFGF